MVKIFKIFKIVNALAFALSFSIAGSSVSKAKEMDRGLSYTWDHFFIYPSNVIDYSVSGSSIKARADHSGCLKGAPLSLK